MPSNFLRKSWSHVFFRHLLAWQLYIKNFCNFVLLYAYLCAIPLGQGGFLSQSSSYKRHEWVNLGKGITSLILSILRCTADKRSNPIPKPPCGTDPNREEVRYLILKNRVSLPINTSFRSDVMKEFYVSKVSCSHLCSSHHWGRPVFSPYRQMKDTEELEWSVQDYGDEIAANPVIHSWAFGHMILSFCSLDTYIQKACLIRLQKEFLRTVLFFFKYTPLLLLSISMIIFFFSISKSYCSIYTGGWSSLPDVLQKDIPFLLVCKLHQGQELHLIQPLSPVTTETDAYLRGELLFEGIIIYSEDCSKENLQLFPTLSLVEDVQSHFSEGHPCTIYSHSKTTC